MSTTSIISPLKSLGKINWSSEVISPFLEDWEVGRVASSCHLSMDLLCQENETCMQGELRGLESPRSLCSECQRRSLVELSRCECSPLTDGL